ncbi:nucleotidyltransferase domain-containing protein [Methylocapsa acidiphila]|uniref:nucleotidyltransferase domain-containing protein n=1 Tax=Methylocapsa acidiphila TaxID=133552 RepID=UPI003CC9151A
MKSGELIAAYIFGSVGRGQQDASSDLDVLAVVRDGGGKVAEDVVAFLYPGQICASKTFDLLVWDQPPA